MKRTAYARNVQYYETDQMGIVHHSNYIRWMEEARIDAMRQMGIDCSRLEEEGMLIPVTQAECRYLHPLHFGEAFTVAVHIAACNGIRLRCVYKIYRERDGRPSATGATEHCFLDKRTMKPIYLERQFPQLNAILKSEAARYNNGEET